MICPNCRIDVAITENSFGALYTCPNCQAVYFINFEGHPEYGEMASFESEAISNVSEAGETHPQGQPPVVDQIQFHQPIEPSSLDLPSFAEPALQFDPGAIYSENTEPIAQVSIESEPSLLGDTFNQNEFAVESEQFQTFSSGPTNDPISVPPASLSTGLSSFAEVAQDLTAFGNSETQLAQLNYNLKIVGIDNAQILAAVKEALLDSRFGWDAEEMIRLVKHGELAIQKMNPVKAYILAKRLHFIDVEKHWVPNAI
jgi:hypothetical protein